MTCRWYAGREPQQGFQCKKSERAHCFTVVHTSQYAHDYCGYKVACRLGDVDKRVQEALRIGFQQISAALATVEAQDGNISAAKFAEAFTNVQLVSADGQAVKLTTAQLDDLFTHADINNDGGISKAEFLRAFKPPKELGLGAMHAAGARTRKKVLSGQADVQDRENEDTLHALQEGLKGVDEDVKREQARAKKKEVCASSYMP
jgi:hypothetical protein